MMHTIITYKYPELKGFLLAMAVVAIGIVTSSCEKEVEVNIPGSDNELVVEGTIENGQPPLVFLMHTVNIFGDINLNNLDAYYVHGANIKVATSDGKDSVLLQEFCLDNLPLAPDEKKKLLASFGFELKDSAKVPNVCLYSTPDLFSCATGGSCTFAGKEQTTYNLTIDVDGKKLTAQTSIPRAIGIDSLTIKPHPNPGSADSLVSVNINFSVPDTFGNFVRYWTKRNKEPFYAPLSASVYDDKLFIGLSIALPAERGQAPRSDINNSTYSYFWKGDSVQIKWANIDSKTYDFYYTLENDGGGSPFSAPVKVKTNIKGGLGVWAGYAAKYYSIYVPK
jgi:hypothetical protein